MSDVGTVMVVLAGMVMAVMEVMLVVLVGCSLDDLR